VICRYSDLISDRLLDNPTIYVVHTWEHSFLETMKGVQDYVYQVSIHFNCDAMCGVVWFK